MAGAKRGWLLDQIMMIGHYEAELTHDDEQICNIDSDMKANSGSLEEIERLTDELAFREQLMGMHYQARVSAEQDIFNAFPDIDRKKWCDIKHAAASYVLAAEVYHARDSHPSARANLIAAGQCLSFLISYTFGFEPMECLRCFNDAMNATTSFDNPVNIMTLPPNNAKAEGGVIQENPRAE